MEYLIGGLAVLVTIFAVVIVVGFVTLVRTRRQTHEHLTMMMETRNDVWAEFKRIEALIEKHVEDLTRNADFKDDTVYRAIDSESRALTERLTALLDSRLDKFEHRLTQKH